MTPQLTLDSALAAKERALAQVERHTDSRVWMVALEAVRVVAERHVRLSTDDVWEQFSRYLWSHISHEPRFIGAAMTVAKKKRWIRALRKDEGEQWINSRRPACHARPIRVWRSLLK